ncbi:hypothetical protein PEBR_43273 [Penicillium brasilianum]|uniref:Uncharacterized protein n=1 Tax=Penicillium brasilianum TaxID=104259 RepID=A0A1S9R8J1_PENBI|nr:hypothetical protein PEBR_43273 [Penicillium brasilianum]
MAGNKRDQAFVVITGDPQQGHGARLSQARSHLARRYHGKKSSQNTRTRQAQQALALHRKLHAVPPDIRLLLTPPPTPLSMPGYNRMQRFMYEYVNSGAGLPRFFSSVIYAAVTHPALMSAKILNASAWDDLSSTEHISAITLQQSHITRQLLNESLAHQEQCFSDVSTAALIALVNFDLNAFENDRAGLECIIEARGGVERLGFEGRLGESLLLIEQFQRIATSPLDSWKTCSPEDFTVLPFAQIDTSVFTLGSHVDDSLWSFMQPLTDLYQSVMHFGTRASSETAALQLENHGYSITPSRPHIPIEQSDHSQRSSQDDPRMSALHQARHLLDLSNSGFEADPYLAYAVAHLKHLLRQTDLDGFWGPLPGALIWCLVIGARLSQPGSSRKWADEVQQTASVDDKMMIPFAQADNSASGLPYLWHETVKRGPVVDALRCSQFRNSATVNADVWGAVGNAAKISSALVLLNGTRAR